MDLNQFAASDAPEKMIIRNPATGGALKDDSGNEFYLMLYGADSAVYQGEIKRRAAQIQREAARNNGKAEPVDLDTAIARGCELLAKCTADGFVINGGELLDCSDQATMAKLYADNRFKWLREQVETFIADRTNFMAGCPAA